MTLSEGLPPHNSDAYSWRQYSLTFSFILLCLLSFGGAATSALPENLLISRIVIIPHAIFDETDEDSFFLHRWANYIHINTKQNTIRRALPFQEGQIIQASDLLESERLLRGQDYLRDCAIRAIPDPHHPNGYLIEISTWDNWTLLPTVSAGRTGGTSQVAVGIKDDNLLGLGIATSLRYKSDQDRDGYRFTMNTPVYYFKHSRVGLDLYDNSDGKATLAHFNKPFYTLDGKHSVYARVLDGQSSVPLRQNGVEFTGFNQELKQLQLHYGWLGKHQPSDTQRWYLGIDIEKHRFSAWNEYPDAIRPQDREFVYPWLAWEYLADEFTILNNVHLINYNEDVNIGWQHYVKLGLETRDTDSLGYHLFWRSNRGWQKQQHLWLMEGQVQAVLNSRQKDHYLARLQGEWFYQFTPQWTFYNRLKLVSSQNNFVDQPLTLGDLQGLRGYPEMYQWGDQQWLYSSELRHYPNINLYQMAELGLAAFTDIGRAFGDNSERNEIQSTLAAIGLGLRLYSSHSSYGNVMHMDFIRPLKRGENIGSWEWRFQVRGRF